MKRLFLIPFLLSASFPFSWIQAEPKRPTIGLVLSGGGARGGAHIGVLKVLEELKIPVDIITATSMGAIVGGLYSMGYTADEVEEIYRDLDWAKILKDYPRRSQISYRRKQDEIVFQVGTPIGFNKQGVQLPKGVIQGQEIILEMKKLTFPVSGIDHFDDLPIRFRAVAMNVENGNAVALSSGSLALSLRASMSLPAIFAPIRIDNQLLIDGGPAKNLPVDVAQQMGADIIIAVDIGTPAVKEEELNSLLAVFGQTFTLDIRENVQEQIDKLSDNDIFIAWTGGDIGSGEFSRTPEAINHGDKAAREVMDRLKKLSVSSEEFERIQTRKKSRWNQSFIAHEIIIHNNSKISEKTIRQELGVKEGDVINPLALRESLSLLFGTGYFEIADYDIRRINGKNQLVINLVAKSWGPNFVRFRLEMEDDLSGNNNFTVGSRIVSTQVNKLGAELQTDILFGEEAGIAGEFYQPLDWFGGVFLAPRYNLGQESLSLFSQGVEISKLRVRRRDVGLDGGVYFRNWGEARIGYVRGWGESRRLSGFPNQPDYDFDDGRAIGILGVDFLDSVRFPRKGGIARLKGDISRRNIGSETDFEKVQGGLLIPVSFGRNTITATLDGGTIVDSDAPLHESFTLGGFLNLSGYIRDELLGPQMSIGKLLYYRALGLKRKSYIGASVESGNVWPSRSHISVSSLIWAGSLWVATDTVVGPIFFSYGNAEGSIQSWYFSIGRNFITF